MKTFKIKSQYEVEIEAEDEEEAIEKFIIDVEVNQLHTGSNMTIKDEFMDNLIAESEVCDGCDEPLQDGQAVIKGENRHSACV